MIAKGSARRAVEIVCGIALIVALFVWPKSQMGWIVQIVSAAVGIGCLVALKKWPSL